MLKFLHHKNSKTFERAIIAFLFCSVSYSQSLIIDKSNFFDETAVHKKNVKSMLVTKKIINSYSKKNDTMIMLTLFEFSKRKVLNKFIVYDASIAKEYNIVEFYDNGQVKRIFRRENDVIMLLREQFFKKNRNQPYKINEYYNGKITGFYKSTFKGKLLSKREYFINNELSEWNEYIYSKEKKIIEEKYFNADNPANEIMRESAEYSLTFYPEHLIKYSYEKKSDTLITIKDRITIGRREIIKNVSNELQNYEIIEKYYNLKLIEVSENLKKSDTTLLKTTLYEDDGKIRSQYITTETAKVIIYIQKNNFPYVNEIKTITTIDTEIDDSGNWYKKTFRENGIVTKIFTRSIVYYNESQMKVK